MKICEIFRPSSIDAAATILFRAGYHKLGASGLYGTVFGRVGESYILKLFKSHDTGYLRYLQLITTVSNPHFPVVKGKPIQVTNIEGGYHAVRLELLEPITRVDHKILKACNDYMRTYDQLKKGESLLNPNNKISHREHDVRIMRDKLSQFEEVYPDLSTALRLIVDHVLSVVGRLDLHEDNMMLRGSTLVITDPVASNIGQSAANSNLPDSLKSPRQPSLPLQVTPSHPSKSTPSQPRPPEGHTAAGMDQRNHGYLPNQKVLDFKSGKFRAGQVW